MDILTSPDPVYVATLEAVVTRAQDYQKTLDLSRANMIANAVGQLFRKGSRG